MVLPEQRELYNPDFLINGKRVRKEGYCTYIITETILDWLKNKRDPDKPFCVLYHQKASHHNRQPAPEYLTLYDDVTFKPTATFLTIMKDGEALPTSKRCKSTNTRDGGTILK